MVLPSTDVDGLGGEDCLYSVLSPASRRSGLVCIPSVFTYVSSPAGEHYSVRARSVHLG